MSWTGLSLVTDAEIGQLEPQATASGAPWGATTWASARTEAKSDLEIWLERDHPEIPGVADRVRDAWNPSLVFALTGGAYTDITTGARDDTAEDIDLAGIFATANTDRIYVGAVFEFDGVLATLLDSLNGEASVMTVNYWGPTGWTDISATDGTASGGATFAQTGRITWTVPTDWGRIDLNSQGQEYYWVEIVISATLTAGTAGTQLLCIQPPKALKRCAAWLALYHILNGLAEASATPERWQDKADGYLEKAQTLYGQVTIPLDLDLSGGVSETEGQTRAVGPIRMQRA